MTKFQAYRIDEAHNVFIEVPESPTGPITIRSWRAELLVIPQSGSACVLPILPTTLSWHRLTAFVEPGCYAVVPGGAVIHTGAGLVIYTPQYIGLPQIGGPAEDVGRLKYIDGCSDSLLVCPAQKGEPCLNLLHLPPGTQQTEHTHPSDRIGIILRGAGVCRTPEGETPLGPGMFWHIPTEHRHSFHTEGESLDVFAWHPDSDFGPSHDWHPMINRTIVDGSPANDARHQGIRTT